MKSHPSARSSLATLVIALIVGALSWGSPAFAKGGKSKAATKKAAKKKATSEAASKTLAKTAKKTAKKAKKNKKKALPRASGDIWIWSPNFREEVRVNIYNADGSLNQASLAALDHGFRCKRTKEERAVDPRLYEILAIISDHFGGKRIELTSGFRFQQNEGSRHFHASAMDIRVEGVSMRELWEFAITLDRGNMGIGKYPRAGFIHIDYRAPGEPSFRWTDRSRRGRGRGKAPSNASRPKS